jgi:allophanate hydrolase
VKLTISALRELYNSGKTKPSDVVAEVYDRIGRESTQPVWISLVPRETALARARELESDPSAAARPLYGIPFAIKDNIDLAGVLTTAGCPAYAYLPERHSTVVERLLAAGAIPIGKTNLDQFATGLVGTRSPYGACSSVFDDRYISGGSSSGSAVAVAKELVSFSLGTDTAGSGRIPAAFNNLVGLKPSRGLISAAGVVPACRSLDCVSIFAANCSDAQMVWRAAKGPDPSDPYSRVPGPGDGAAPWAGGSFRFGVPAPHQLEFFGDQESTGLYYAAVPRLEQLGGTKIEIDFSIFRAVAELLYSGPWVAERLAGILPFFEARVDDMNSVVRGIIGGARRYSAVDAFDAEYRLRTLRRASEREWQRMDVLMVPSAPAIYTHDEIAADPVRLNTNLGYYTNFVNLLDQAAVATPGGFRSNGLPFGITLIGPAFTDEALLALADRFHRSHADVAGQRVDLGSCPPGCIPLAVVGAHLSGQPLNWQLTERRARLLKVTRTMPCYRFYALPGTQPPSRRVREEGFQGPASRSKSGPCRRQIWKFCSSGAAPLSIGNAILKIATRLNASAEPYALSGAASHSFGAGDLCLLCHACRARVSSKLF